jgi:hypothetical protein
MRTIGKYLASSLNKSLDTNQFRGSMTIKQANGLLAREFDRKYHVAHRDGVTGIYGSYRHFGL